MPDKRKPLIHGDLVDAAAAIVLTQHDSPYVSQSVVEGGRDVQFETEECLQTTRDAASAYLVACFDYAKGAFEADEAAE